MRRFLVSTLIPLLAVLAMALPAEAGLTWCKSDPIVLLDGTQLQVLVGVPAEYVPYVNGPVSVRIKTPKSVTEQLLFADLGYNGYGEAVTFGDLKATTYETTFDTNIQVSVPFASGVNAESVQLEVTAIPSNALSVVKYGNASGTTVGLKLAPTN